MEKLKQLRDARTTAAPFIGNQGVTADIRIEKSARQMQKHQGEGKSEAMPWKKGIYDTAIPQGEKAIIGSYCDLPARRNFKWGTVTFENGTGPKGRSP